MKSCKPGKPLKRPIVKKVVNGKSVSTYADQVEPQQRQSVKIGGLKVASPRGETKPKKGYGQHYEEKKTNEKSDDRRTKWREEREQFIKAVRTSKKIKQLEDFEKVVDGDDKALI